MPVRTRPKNPVEPVGSARCPRPARSTTSTSPRSATTSSSSRPSVCEQIGAATQALLDGDLQMVDRVYRRPTKTTRLGSIDLEQRVYQLFALQHPLAADLRSLARGPADPARDRAHGGPDAQRRPPDPPPVPARAGTSHPRHHRAHGRAGERADAPRGRRLRRQRRQHRGRAARHGRRHGRPPEGALPQRSSRPARPTKGRCRARCRSRSSAATTNVPPTTR